MAEQGEAQEGQENGVLPLKRAVLAHFDPQKEESPNKFWTWSPSKNKELDQLDLAIMREVIANPRARYSDIAQKLSQPGHPITPVTIGKRMRADVFQRFLAEQRKHVSTILKDGLGRAARKLLKLIDSNDERVSLMACKTLLEGWRAWKFDEDVPRETKEGVIERLRKYAERYSISLEEYCKRNGIELELIQEVKDGPN